MHHVAGTEDALTKWSCYHSHLVLSLLPATFFPWAAVCPHLPLALQTPPPTPPRLTSKDKEKDDSELIDGVTQDVLHHSAWDQRLISAIGATLQQRVCRRLCGQGQWGKSVHDEINPQHLHGFQWGILVGRRTTPFSFPWRPPPTSLISLIFALEMAYLLLSTIY